MSKCKHHQGSPIEQYIRECDLEDVAPQDVYKGDYCSGCGKKVKLLEYSELPDHLQEAYYG